MIGLLSQEFVLFEYGIRAYSNVWLFPSGVKNVYGLPVEDTVFTALIGLFASMNERI